MGVQEIPSSNLGSLTEAINRLNGEFLLSKTDGRSVQTLMSYDEMNRLTVKSYVGSGATATDSVEYTYDDPAVPNAFGHLTKVSNGNVWQVSQFDVMGHPVASSQTTAGVTYPSFGYTYNLAGEMLTVTYPSGRTVTTAYDQAGRISKVTGVANKTYVSAPTDFTAPLLRGSRRRAANDGRRDGGAELLQFATASHRDAGGSRLNFRLCRLGQRSAELEFELWDDE